MPRYINVDMSEGEIVDKVQEISANADIFLTVRKVLATFPTVDAVEVVRCKDCRFWAPEKRECHHNNRKDTMFAYDFCSSGDRKEQNDDKTT